MSLLQQFPRQALHAFKLDFAHPLSGQNLNFAAPIPPDLGNLMQVLTDDAQ